MFDTWNGMNFPYRLEKDNGMYILYKYLLDDIYGNVDITDTVKKIIWSGKVLDFNDINNLIKKGE